MSDGPDQSSSLLSEAEEKFPGFLTIFPSIMLPIFLAVVDQTIVATALPAIAAATGELERVSWIVVGYLIAATIAAPIYGRLGDAYGRRRLMFFALVLFMLASVLCALAPTIELLLPGLFRRRRGLRQLLRAGGWGFSHATLWLGVYLSDQRADRAGGARARVQAAGA